MNPFCLANDEYLSVPILVNSRRSVIRIVIRAEHAVDIVIYDPDNFHDYQTSGEAYPIWWSKRRTLVDERVSLTAGEEFVFIIQNRGDGVVKGSWEIYQ